MAFHQNPPNPNTTTMATPSLDSPAKSFDMDRRSPEASKLRDAVSQKLFDYLGNYSDDILAEYIVVLVCNGKNQIQARDDLEAFLGEESENFVIWLWDHLSKRTIASGPSIHYSDNKTEVKSTHVTSVAKAQGTSRHNCDAESKEHPELSNFSMGSSFSKTTDNLERFNLHCSMDVPSDKENAKKLDVKSLVVHDKFGAKDENRGRTQRSMHSVVKHSSDALHGGEQCLQYERQHQKITKRNPVAVPYQSLHVPKEEPLARTLQTVKRENTASRPVLITSAAAMDVEESRINRPRGSVWDRLGRPVDDHYTPLGGGNKRHSHTFSNSRDISNHSEDLHDSTSSFLEEDAKLSGKLMEKFISLDEGCARVSSDNYTSKYENHKCDELGSSDDFGKLKRERQYRTVDSGNSSANFSELGEECIRDKCPKKQDSLSVKFGHHHKADVLATEMKDITARRFVPAAKSFNPDAISRPVKVVSAQIDEKASWGILNQDSNSTYKIEAHQVVKCATRNSSSTPTTDVVLDVKEKLLQVERDMIKLRARQADMSNLKNTGLTGSQNNLEEDIDSRSVLVTNIHFAASREALSNYFTKCGPIAEVTMLNDPVTSQPKGAAYIVFASKESAVRAISCSGTSFFSRLLKVTRKAEVPPSFLFSAQAVVRSQQSSYPPFQHKGFSQRHQMSSHLQWRRNDSTSKENSLSACADGLQSFSCGK